MAFFSRIKEWISPSMYSEKRAIVHRIEEETKRLNGALDDLSREVKTVRKDRAAMTKVFDDALQAMNKDYRK